MSELITPSNPSDPAQSLKRPLNGEQLEVVAHPPQLILPADSAVTNAEKVERNGSNKDSTEPFAKRIKQDDTITTASQNGIERMRGIAPVKAEYIVQPAGSRRNPLDGAGNDDAAEAKPNFQMREELGGKRDDSGGKRKKPKGQNIARQFGHWGDAIQLCNSRARSAEFSPKECRFGESCRLSHNLRKYLQEGKREELNTFGGQCPVWEINGICHAGWKCRFVGSHSEEIERKDGRKELVLQIDPRKALTTEEEEDETRKGVVNAVGAKEKIALSKRTMKTEKAEQYTSWLEDYSSVIEDKNSRVVEDKRNHQAKAGAEVKNAATNEAIISEKPGQLNSNEPAEGAAMEEPAVSNLQEQGCGSHEPSMKDAQAIKEQKEDHRAHFIDPPFWPAEKRKVYFGLGTPVLAPLTTQGNLPFRRLCVKLGAQVTYSEMAMAMPLVQGQKSEWALMKAHESEISPPQYTQKGIVRGYDNAKDLKFGAQVSANKPWLAAKVAEVLVKLVPHLRVIDLNCGCPIDLVYRTGAGSGLLDSPGKLEKMVRSMNSVSGEIPITTKIRMGTTTGKPNAVKIIERLAFGGPDMRKHLGAPGCAAITLHGRSRQQRYTKSADWSYIAECAALIKSYNEKKAELTDTINEPDPRTQANTSDGKMYFIGNGDCYSHTDYLDHIRSANVDSVMVARGAMIKPWIFEEIEAGQYLDKSASERLGYVEKFTRYGLESWGSDEQGVGQTRRFLLEWLSFAHRYVPVGILEHLPPSLQDRPPAYKGRNDLETLLASDNYLDWIKISEMFLGPAHKDFRFQPKHKSNSYEIEAEG